MWKNDVLVSESGFEISPNFSDPVVLKQMADHCLGECLENGFVIHAGFFMGRRDFYEGLRSMPQERRQLISMRSVLKINQLFGHEEIDRLHRKDARFMNTALMMTLLERLSPMAWRTDRL